ncbi:MAG: hypothetical protein M3Q42_15350 [Pseudomonadota bacterium]|nr:hypothetical protein [Pseudomonadota bacterium]
MAAPHTKPITVRFNSATRQRLLNRAEKQSQTTADVIRSIVADHLAGNEIEHRIRVSLEEVMTRTRQEISETVQRTVEEAILFVLEKHAGGVEPAPTKVSGPPPLFKPPAPRAYNRTLLAQGRYDSEITEALLGMARFRMEKNPIQSLEHFVLELLNEGWKGDDFDLPMKVPSSR